MDNSRLVVVVYTQHKKHALKSGSRECTQPAGPARSNLTHHGNANGSDKLGSYCSGDLWNVLGTCQEKGE
ncbi:hypothetical protein AX774_g2780 [Zancudomyces culisetae]|uniref:Uncharacterized protein n=1 Tax=Zancudomyces culisetae TaxID=1213189 RepID=A0A1R1PRX3_ZANCU|nr:hypothetical protein AX774_g2780 [Zancudomyces culisetae]|eukprot:OMH83704.1 hypothetical protein AX774_g2780 [Zancudomyces culisetae]